MLEQETLLIQDTFLDVINNYAKINELFLKKILDIKTKDIVLKTSLHKALEYVLLNGGKRLRPFLVYFIGKIFDISDEKLHAPAAAIELIHTYSLVHDDLPAMDNDDFRRGLPSCHKAFDEATAILTGDALLTLAFDILSDPFLNPNSDAQKIKMISILSQASGISGMICGQDLELYSKKQNINVNTNEYFELLKKIHHKKTGALISASIELGLTPLQSIDENLSKYLNQFGQTLGLLYQVQDDIFDNDGFVILLGKEKAEKYAIELYQNQIEILKSIPLEYQKIQELKNLNDYFFNRKN